ncbi:hypothetical protein MPH_10507 [Macrophomina phaseolina MS6]|uniref:Uncharacterized protein n=2 Tax=Macrophomina phaseolina TaxID=35725 RepID=K2S6G9_MACPH|nr:hypothetical protein MPH_10507 [Macrophomina phaseolina MS6]KAH7055961.1 hypothetical protein B0J12DRAFT_438122 [Macrophomina phaseolina]
MSKAYEGQDLNKIAQQAEQDLNSYAAKTGHDLNLSSNHGKGASVSTTESGVDVSRAQQFPGGDVRYGSSASGAGDNREIPLEEGGDIQKGTGRPTKAGDFEGVGGPEDKAQIYRDNYGGNNDVTENIRQGPGGEPKA